MTWRKGLARVIAALRPWPSRADRKAAQKAAVARRRAAEQRTGHARQAAQSITEIVYQHNQFAASIAEQITRGHHNKKGER